MADKSIADNWNIGVRFGDQPKEVPFADSWTGSYIQSREQAIDEDTAAWLKAQEGTAGPVGQEGQGAAPAVPTSQEATGSPPSAAGPSGLVSDQEQGPLASGAAYVGKTALDIPLQTIGAFRDVTNQISHLVYPVSSLLDKAAPFGFTDQGELVTPFDSRAKLDAYLAQADRKRADAIDVPEGRTGASDFYRQVMRFAIGFKGVGSVLTAVKSAPAVGGVATKALSYAPNLTRGALTDMMVWDEHEARLSDLIQEYPALQNPVTEWLASDKSDGMLEGKLKQAIEGTGLSVAAKALQLLVKSIHAIREGRRAQQAIVDTGTKAVEASNQATREAEQLGRELATMGDPNGPLLVKRNTEATDVKNAILETAPKTPEAVKAAEANMGKGTAAKPLTAAEAEAAASSKAVAKLVPNFAAIKNGDDIEKILQGMAEANSKLIGAARGGRKSHKSQIAAAQEIGIQELFNIEAGRYTVAELRALQEFYFESATTLRQLSEVAINAPTTGNLYNFRKMAAVHQALLERYSAAKAEAARALGILGAAHDLGKAERVTQIAELLDQFGGADVALDLAKKVAALKDADPKTFNELVKGGAGARTLDAVAEAWTLGLVSSPVSQARNILSNAAFMWTNILERRLAAEIPGSDIEKGEALAQVFGITTSLRQAFINAGKAFWNGTSGYGVGKVDLPHRKALSAQQLKVDGWAGHVIDAFGEFYRIWGRALNAGDEFFKTINYSGELAALGWRRATREGLTGEDFYQSVAKAVVQPDEELRMLAMAAAKYGTFTDRLGTIGSMWQRMVNAAPFPLRFLTPFVRTPGNIFKAGFSRTPFALVMPKTFWEEVKAGGSRADLAITRMALGTATMGLLADMTARGMVSGNGPSDPSLKASMRRNGWQPYSFKLPDSPVLNAIGLGGKWISYKTFEPLGTIMGMAADMTELVMEYQEAAGSDDPAVEAKSENIMWKGVAAAGSAVTSQSFTRSISEFFTMMSNPDMYAEKWLQRYASTVVPRFVAAINKSIDGTARDVGGMLDAIQKEIPGASENLPPVRNLWGEPVQLGGAYGPDWISPLYVSDPKNDPADSEIIAQKIRVRKPGWSQGWQDQTTGLTVNVDMHDFRDVYDEFQRLAGNGLKHPGYGMGAHDLLNAIVSGKHELSGVYRQLPNGDEQGFENKGAFIKAILADYRAQAKVAILTDPQYDERFRDFRREVSARATRKIGIIQQSF